MLPFKRNSELMGIPPSGREIRVDAITRPLSHAVESEGPIFSPRAKEALRHHP